MKGLTYVYHSNVGNDYESLIGHYHGIATSKVQTQGRHILHGQIQGCIIITRAKTIIYSMMTDYHLTTEIKLFIYSLNLFD